MLPEEISSVSQSKYRDGLKNQKNTKNNNNNNKKGEGNKKKNTSQCNIGLHAEHFFTCLFMRPVISFI